MLKDIDSAEVGQTVYLYPRTKTADQDCHAQRVCEVVTDLKCYWPMVLVRWDHPKESRKVQRLIHRDNIRLHPASTAPAAGEGDATTDHEAVTYAKPRVLAAGRPKPIELPDNMEQGELF